MVAMNYDLKYNSFLLDGVSSYWYNCLLNRFSHPLSWVVLSQRSLLLSEGHISPVLELVVPQARATSHPCVCLCHYLPRTGLEEDEACVDSDRDLARTPSGNPLRAEGLGCLPALRRLLEQTDGSRTRFQTCTRIERQQQMKVMNSASTIIIIPLPGHALDLLLISPLHLLEHLPPSRPPSRTW